MAAIPNGTRNANRLLQPKYSVSIPPITGPVERPRYTAVTFIPSALPLSPAGNTEVIIAILVPNIMAPAIPWITLKTIIETMFHANIISIADRVNKVRPAVNIFFRPAISASLPKGSRKTADESMKLLIIHPSSMALALNSFPIEGSARFTADPRKGVR